MADLDRILSDEELDDEDQEVCTRCGEVCDELTYIDDVEHVCEECLDAFYEKCDICGEYWDLSIIAVRYVERIDKFVCEHCMEDLDPEEDEE